MPEKRWVPGWGLNGDDMPDWPCYKITFVRGDGVMCDAVGLWLEMLVIIPSVAQIEPCDYGAEYLAKVNCRTCGIVPFSVCAGCAELLAQAGGSRIVGERFGVFPVWAKTRIYCTKESQGHEIVGLMELESCK